MRPAWWYRTVPARSWAGREAEGQATHFSGRSCFALWPQFAFPTGDVGTSLCFEGAGVGTFEMPLNICRVGVRRTGPDSFQWCPATGQEAHRGPFCDSVGSCSPFGCWAVAAFAAGGWKASCRMRTLARREPAEAQRVPGAAAVWRPAS